MSERPTSGRTKENGVTDDRMSERTERRTDGRTSGRAGQMKGRTDERIDGRTSGRTAGRTVGCTDGRTHERTDERTDGPADGQTYGRSDRMPKPRRCAPASSSFVVGGRRFQEKRGQIIPHSVTALHLTRIRRPTRSTGCSPPNDPPPPLTHRR